MKRQRRQELKANDLSVYLLKSGEFLQQNGVTVLLVAVGVIIAAGGAAWWREGRATRAAESWNRYYEAAQVTSSAEPDNSIWVDDAMTKWQQTIDESTDVHVEIQSKWALATLCLRQAVDATEPSTKKSFLDTAARYCAEIRDGRDASTVQHAAALNCLATVEFDRFILDGDIGHKERARAWLEQIRNGEDYRGTPFQADALERLNHFEALWEPLVLEASPPPSPPPAAEAVPSPQAPAPVPGGPGNHQETAPPGDPNSGAVPGAEAPTGDDSTGEPGKPMDKPNADPGGGQ